MAHLGVSTVVLVDQQFRRSAHNRVENADAIADAEVVTSVTGIPGSYPTQPDPDTIVVVRRYIPTSAVVDREFIARLQAIIVSGQPV
jgi:hypothetical protein